MGSELPAVLLLVLWTAVSTVFTQGDVNPVYVGENGTFTCNAGINEYPAWQVETLSIFPQTNSYTSVSRGVHVPSLDEQTLSAAENRSSTLTIEGRVDTNSTVIRCGVYTQCCSLDFSMGAGTQHIFTVYGAPSPPADIQITQTLSTILVSWSEPFSPGPSAPSYQLEISLDNGTILEHSTNSTSLLLATQHLSCSARVRVLASNPSGQSNSSEVLNVLISAEDTKEGISESTSHEVEASEELLNVTVSFKQPDYCPFYSDYLNMTGYYIMLREVTAGDQLRLGPYAVDTGYNEGRVHLFFQSSWVVQNAVYNYSVQLAENSTISEGNTLYTTDVQDAHLIVDRSRNSLEVNCSFMASSSALGCVFELNGEFTYISIEEARYRFSAEGSLDNFIFSVYDWEHDGSMGRQPVPVCVHETTLNPTTSPATGVPTGGIVAATERPKVPVTLVVALAVVGFVVLFLLLTVIIIIAIMVMRKKASRMTISGDNDKRIDEGQEKQKDSYRSASNVVSPDPRYSPNADISEKDGPSTQQKGTQQKGTKQNGTQQNGTQRQDAEQGGDGRTNGTKEDGEGDDTSGDKTVEKEQGEDHYDTLYDQPQHLLNKRTSHFRFTASPPPPLPLSPPPSQSSPRSLPPSSPPSLPPSSPPPLPPCFLTPTSPIPLARNEEQYSELSTTAGDRYSTINTVLTPTSPIPLARNEEQYSELSTAAGDRYSTINTMPVYHVLENSEPTYSEVSVRSARPFLASPPCHSRSPLVTPSPRAAPPSHDTPPPSPPYPSHLYTQVHKVSKAVAV